MAKFFIGPDGETRAIPERRTDFGWREIPRRALLPDDEPEFKTLLDELGEYTEMLHEEQTPPSEATLRWEHARQAAEERRQEELRRRGMHPDMTSWMNDWLVKMTQPTVEKELDVEQALDCLKEHLDRTTVVSTAPQPPSFAATPPPTPMPFSPLQWPSSPPPQTREAPEEDAMDLDDPF